MNAVLNGVYIDGTWRAGHEVLEVINPATEEVSTGIFAPPSFAALFRM